MWRVFVIQHTASGGYYQKTRKREDFFTPYICGAKLFEEREAIITARLMTTNTPGETYAAVPYTQEA